MDTDPSRHVVSLVHNELTHTQDYLIVTSAIYDCASVSEKTLLKNDISPLRTVTWPDQSNTE